MTYIVTLTLRGSSKSPALKSYLDVIYSSVSKANYEIGGWITKRK